MNLKKYLEKNYVSRYIMIVVSVIIGYCIARPLGVQWELIGIGTIFMAFGTGPYDRLDQKSCCGSMLSEDIREKRVEIKGECTCGYTLPDFIP